MVKIRQICIYILFILLGGLLLFIINSFVPLLDLEFQNNNPGVISSITSVLLVFVTLLYVILTGLQVQEIEKQSMLLQKETKVSKQPCIIPEIISTHGSACFPNSERRQLHINISLKNFGDSPALSIFTIGYFELQNTTFHNRNIVKMDYIPDYVTGIETNSSKEVSIRFETKEINALLNDLNIYYKKNVERVQYNPTQKAYPGTHLVIKTYYRNLIGQWFEGTVKREIAHLKDIEDNTGNISISFETVIPPQPLLDSTRYELCFIAQRFSPSNVRTIKDEEVEKILSEYDSEDIYGKCQIINSGK